MEARPQPQLSVLAVIAMVMALVFAPVGLVLAIIALVRIRRSHGELTGTFLAAGAVVANAFLTFGFASCVYVIGFANPGCATKQDVAKANLLSLYSAQKLHRASHGTYAELLTDMQFVPKGEHVDYAFVVVKADPAGFVAEARGYDRMGGDVWRIDEQRALTNVTNACE